MKCSWSYSGWISDHVIAFDFSLIWFLKCCCLNVKSNYFSGTRAWVTKRIRVTSSPCLLKLETCLTSLRPHLLPQYKTERMLMWCMLNVWHSYLKLHSASWAEQVSNSTTESCTHWGQWNMKMCAVLLDVVIASWAISEDTNCVLVKAWYVFWGRIMGFCLIFVRFLTKTFALAMHSFLRSSRGKKDYLVQNE